MGTNEELIGTVLEGKYRLDRLIGNGGMGAVYAGTHKQLGRTVAVKILRSDLVSDSMMLARFEREARASARIEHPNAIRVYDFGSHDDYGTYLVMEYAEGISLRQFLASRGRLALPVALDLLQQAAAALESAHQNGVVHRDVKPENMMICFGVDDRLVLKVVDFGIAKLLSTDGVTQLTRPSDIIGTPRYMAPEQFTGDDIDSRVDVYALGVVLFELLTGRAPFEGTFSEIIGKHIYAEPPSFETAGVELSAEVEAVVRRALAKSPDARPQSPIELAIAFADACGPEIAASVTSPFAAIVRPSGELPEVVDPSEQVTSFGGTIVGGSSDQAEHFATNVATGETNDDPTVVRPRSTPRPESARFEVPLVETHPSGIERVRTTARLFVPPALLTRWGASAALSFVAIAVISMVVWRGDSRAAGVVTTEASAPAAVAVEPSPAPVTARPSEAAATVSDETVTSDESTTTADAGAQTSRSERRHASGSARRPQDSTIRRVGRALRVDQQLRKLF